jgi:YD repeat-containing protein
MVYGSYVVDYKNKNRGHYKTTEHYAYDEMDRISSWQYNRVANKEKKRTALVMNRSYEYDIDGNMVKKTGVGQMIYNAKNQLVSVESDSNYAYDANGNMLHGNDKNYEYNAFNKVKYFNSLPRSP